MFQRSKNRQSVILLVLVLALGATFLGGWKSLQRNDFNSLAFSVSQEVEKPQESNIDKLWSEANEAFKDIEESMNDLQERLKDAAEKELIEVEKIDAKNQRNKLKALYSIVENIKNNVDSKKEESEAQEILDIIDKISRSVIQPAESGFTQEGIKSIQEALQEENVYKRQVDGIFGTDTQTAINEYLKDRLDDLGEKLKESSQISNPGNLSDSTNPDEQSDNAGTPSEDSNSPNHSDRGEGSFLKTIIIAILLLAPVTIVFLILFASGNGRRLYGDRVNKVLSLLHQLRYKIFELFKTSEEKSLQEYSTHRPSSQRQSLANRPNTLPLTNRSHNFVTHSELNVLKSQFNSLNNKLQSLTNRQNTLFSTDRSHNSVTHSELSLLRNELNSLRSELNSLRSELETLINRQNTLLSTNRDRNFVTPSEFQRLCNDVERLKRQQQENKQNVSAEYTQSQRNVFSARTASNYPSSSSASTTESNQIYTAVVQTYNTNPNALSQGAIEVSETAESINQGRLDVQQSVILEKAKRNQGSYWILTEGDSSYLVPKPGKKLNPYSFRSLESLFVCRNYNPSFSTNFRLIKPCIVYPINQGETWKLIEPGELEFS